MDRIRVRIGALRIFAEIVNSMKDLERNQERTMLALSPRSCMKGALGDVIERGTEAHAGSAHNDSAREICDPG
ncbi:hypothetical protein BDR03DRAFT_971589 [Suillus americanus]|nr:hypothetical protein BDR03DRAFT_971589 [Suillus americanus]